MFVLFPSKSFRHSSSFASIPLVQRGRFDRGVPVIARRGLIMRHLDVGICLQAMAEEGMPLLIHGEVTTPGVDIFDREERFIEEVIKVGNVGATWSKRRGFSMVFLPRNRVSAVGCTLLFSSSPFGFTMLTTSTTDFAAGMSVDNSPADASQALSPQARDCFTLSRCSLLLLALT